MTTNPVRRDYGLVGPETKRAVAMGLAEAEWYRSPIPRARLKEMMQRTGEVVDSGGDRIEDAGDDLEQTGDSIGAPPIA